MSCCLLGSCVLVHFLLEILVEEDDRKLIFVQIKYTNCSWDEATVEASNSVLRVDGLGCSETISEHFLIINRKAKP